MSNYDVFVSYARRDNEAGTEFFVTRLVEAIKNAGLAVWIDTGAIKTGAEWEAQIRAGIENADNLLFVVSENSLNSKACHDEIEYARRLKKRILPFFYQSMDALQPALGRLFQQPFAPVASENWQYINKFQRDQNYPTTKNFETSVANLITDIKENPECRSFHTQLTQQTVYWLSTGRNEGALLRGEALKNAETRKGDCQSRMELSGEQIAFIAESQRAEKEKQEEERRRLSQLKRLSLARWILLAVTLLAVAATGLAVQQLQAADFVNRLSNALNLRARGSNSYLIGDFETARTLYQSALDVLNPSGEDDWGIFTDSAYVDAGIHIGRLLNDLGVTCAQIEDFDCAVASLQAAATTANRDFPDPYRNLADVYRASGQLTEARAVITELASKEIELDIQIDRITAAIEYDSGNYQVAMYLLDTWRDEIKPQPDDPDSGIFSAFYLDMVYYTALSYEGLGDHNRACDFWGEHQNTRFLYPPTIPILWASAKYAQALRSFEQCQEMTDQNAKGE